MNIHSARHKAYTLNGNNTFPLYGVQGEIVAGYVCILFTGRPDRFDGGSFGAFNEVHSDNGGSWIVVTFGHYDTESDIAHKIAQAENLLDEVE